MELLPVIQLPPSSSCLLSSACPLSTSCPLSLCLGFSFSSRLIVFVAVARVEEVDSSGEGKLVREGRASASRHRSRCRQGGFWVLAKRVLGRAITACAVEQGGEKEYLPEEYEVRVGNKAGG